MVQRPQDVLLEMKDVLRGYLNEDLLAAETTEVSPEPKQKTAPGKASPSKQSDVVPAESPQPPVPAKPSRKPVSLTSVEQFIVDLLRHEAMVFDELAARAYGEGIDVPKLTSLLMKLELRSVIRQLPGRYYVLFE